MTTEIATGVKLLDEVSPNWAASINLKTFNMRSPFSCVLGQVFGDYWTGCDTLSQNKDTSICCFNFAKANGFTISCLPQIDFSHAFVKEAPTWADLAKQWEAVIRERQQNGKP